MALLAMSPMGILPMCLFFVFSFNGKNTAGMAVILMGGTPMLRNNRFSLKPQ